MIRPISWIDTFALSVLVWRERKIFNTSPQQSGLIDILPLLDDPAWKVARQIFHRCLGEINKANNNAGGGSGQVAIDAAVLERLMPHEQLPWIVNSAPLMRFHLPIVTNPASIIYSGLDARNLLPGQFSYVDIGQLHSAVNHGDTPRYHLIIDIHRNSTVEQQT